MGLHDYTPYTDIKEYLVDDFHIELYKSFTNNWFLKESGDEPVDYFNELYDEYYFFVDNNHDFIKMMRLYDVKSLKKEDEEYLAECSTREYKKKLQDYMYYFGYYNHLLQIIRHRIPFQDMTCLQKQGEKLIEEFAEAYIDMFLKATNDVKALEECETLSDYVRYIEDIVENSEPTEIDEANDLIAEIVKAKHKYIKQPYKFSDKHYTEQDFFNLVNSEVERIRETILNLIPVTEGSITNESLKYHTETEQHPKIFNGYAFILFEYLISKSEGKKGGRGRQAEISYYYRRMEADNYIHAKPVPFLNWFNETYDENIDVIKRTCEVSGGNKSSDYSKAVDWYNLNKPKSKPKSAEQED